jgi:hypothetical protein
MIAPEKWRWPDFIRKAAGSRLRLLYILSLVALAALVIYTVFRPLTVGGEFSEVTRQALLQTGDEWILQFQVGNHEGRDIEYRIIVTIGGNRFVDHFMVKDGGLYTYTHHINKTGAAGGGITCQIFKEGEERPLAENSYSLTGITPGP